MPCSSRRPASIGKNGRNSEAMAMLIMLPRLALIVVWMYLRVFAKVVPDKFFYNVEITGFKPAHSRG